MTSISDAFLAAILDVAENYSKKEKLRLKLLAEKYVIEFTEIRDSLEELQTLRIKQAKLRADLVPMERRIDELVRLLHGATRPKKVLNNPRPADVVHNVVKILRSNGSPMSARELYEALSLHHIIINGVDPLKVLRTTLYRSPSVIHIPDYGYWPTGEPYEPANYVPDYILAR